jgi:hypothetical protein
MYQVTVKKFLRYDDRRTAFEEAREEVNHERHALNLAAKIAGYHEVEWVEIEELRGRFKIRASRASNGEVQTTSQSRRGGGQRKTSFYGERSSRISRIIFASLLGLGALGYLVSQTIRHPLIGVRLVTRPTRAIQIGDFHVRAVALVFPSAELMRMYGLTPRNGYRPLTVSINVTNEGQSTNCLEFDPLLVVRSDRKSLMPGSSALKGTNAYYLRPAENRDGSYVYQMKYGADPLLLELVPKPTISADCRRAPASILRSAFIGRPSISLEGLPKPW